MKSKKKNLEQISSRCTPLRSSADSPGERAEAMKWDS